MMKTVSLTLLMFSLIFSCLLQAQQLNVRFNINEPCNVRILNADGEYLRPDSSYFWKGFMGTVFPDFPVGGAFDIKLAPGKYQYEFDRGPEYALTKGNLIVGQKSLVINLRLKRLVDLKKKNWWSGEMHIHRKPQDIELLMKASDLHVGPVIVSWNEHFAFTRTDTVYEFSVKKFDNDRYYSVTGSEDERNGGAILVLNTPKPVNFSIDHRKEFPPLVKSAERVVNEFKDSVWIDVEKPFWIDMPVLLAAGKINSLGIAHNHMNQGGVYDNEAWGRQRDRNKYPFPMGNGYYTQDIYYHVLNSGLRIPPSAGSASGVLLNPVGYNRVYAYVENGLTYEKWFSSVREGKTFISNGPLLLMEANKELPGYVFSGDRQQDIKISGEIISRDTLDKIEIIKNGKVYKTIPASALKSGRFSSRVTFDKSGWFLVRVICAVSNNFRFASSAPYYVEIGENKRLISRASAKFFLDWVNERARTVKAENDDELMEIKSYLDKAARYWEGVMNKSTEE